MNDPRPGVLTDGHGDDPWTWRRLAKVVAVTVALWAALVVVVPVLAFLAVVWTGGSF